MKISFKHLTDQQIAQHAENMKSGLPEQSGENILSHLKTCNSCQLKVLEVYELIKNDDKITINKTQSEIKFQPISQKKSLLLKYIAAASIVFLLFSSFLTYLLVSKNNHVEKKPVQVVDNNDTVKKHPAISPETEVIVANPGDSGSSIISHSVLSGENYKKFSPFEGMVNNELRSSDNIRVICPKPEEILPRTDKVVFQFEGNGHNLLTINVFDNKGHEIAKIDDITNKFELKNNFEPGLYYWKLTDSTKKNLIYIGKFFID